MRLYHVWHRAPGTELWKHHAFQSELLASAFVRFYETNGHEVQLRPGSVE